MGDVDALTARWRQALRGRRVLLTGHTGFKGSWLALWLAELGAQVTGFALPPVPGRTLFADAHVDRVLNHIEGDIRDRSAFEDAWLKARPELVFHLAAQAVVRESYRDPLTTLTTNAIGTAHVLDLARQHPADLAGLVLITSDKCYENHEWDRGYHERDELGGHDPYSASKAAAELIISSYRRSFFGDRAVGVASARAGNVIGGGDWSVDRIVPDAIRALEANQPIIVRSPTAVRPWQHVLEPLSGYLTLASRFVTGTREERERTAQAWNFGPTRDHTRTVSELVNTIVKLWGAGDWRDGSRPDDPHEATLLRLDITKAEAELSWRPRWSFEQSITATVEWYTARARGEGVAALCRRQIADYEASA
ncbi:MAG TPA: CDP-glucose 4,6-dehydratase [Vicinamibacterales bacterium]|nr:CDP-glucose 4,6-dehydratase [Vicinamibacterales bacterium]